MKKYLMQKTRESLAKEELWRPAYHFTAPKGWLNDPNGLIYYKGYYHLFYQHNPKHCNWASMHWGHAVSEDMLHWKDLPIALYPDQPYDNHCEGGCFSGSAVEKDGILYLFYTATVRDDTRGYQTQCMAYSKDGIHFTKSTDNPLITEPPKGASNEFRDPKVFAVDNKWYLVIGGSVVSTEGVSDGRVFLYTSDDLHQWNYLGNVIESNGHFGSMMECPDFFELNGKWVLVCSPIDYPGKRQTLYLVGTMNFETCRFVIENTGNLDYGFDYYAPQSFLDEKGNRVLIGWQNSWPWMPWCEDCGPTDIEGWRGALSIPRIATLDEESNILLQPVENMKTLMKLDYRVENVNLSASKYILHPSNPYSYEIKVYGQVNAVEDGTLEIGLRGHEDKVTLVTLDFISGIMTIDRSSSDEYSTGKISCVFDNKVEEFDLQLLVDHSSVEAILFGGKHYMTANVYPKKEQTECYIRTTCKSAQLSQVAVSTIHNVWRDNV